MDAMVNGRLMEKTSATGEETMGMTGRMRGTLSGWLIGGMLLASLLVAPHGARGGDLDPPTAPDAQGTRHSLQNIYNLLDTGTAGQISGSSFVEPTGAPADGSMPDLEAIWTKAPKTDAGGAIPAQVCNGKSFWGRNSSAWGPRTGTGPCPPAFNLPLTGYPFSVSENAANGTAVGTVSATGAGTVAYSIQSSTPGSAPFTINGGSGQITVNGSIDYETVKKYDLLVRVTDGAPNAGAYDEMTVTVQVSNLDDNDPAFVSTGPFSVSEDATVATAVGRVSAQDADGDALKYRISAGNTGSAFSIGESTGQLTVAGALDFETVPTYSLTVDVSDDNYATVTQATVSVYVRNVNDSNPAFSNSGPYGVKEDARVGQIVGFARANDADGNPLTFSETGGTGAGLFQIDTTGCINVQAASLDYETTTSYTYIIQVSDGTRTASATATINVTDANEPPYEVTNAGLTCTAGSTNQTIDESELEYRDHEQAAANVQYTLVRPPAAGVLELSGTPIVLGGTFTQAQINSNNLKYDAPAVEGTQSFTFTVRDGQGGVVCDQIFTITVNPAP